MKIFRKRRKWRQSAFPLFTTVFDIQTKTKINIWATINLLSANTFNLDNSKISSFCREIAVDNISFELNFDCVMRVCVRHSHSLYVWPFPKQALVFTYLQYRSFENTVGKREIACNDQFLPFPQCFLPVWKPSVIFIRFKIVVYKLFQFGRV